MKWVKISYGREKKDYKNKYNNKIQKCLILVTFQKENIRNHNPKWPEIPDYPYLMLIFEGSGSG